MNNDKQDHEPDLLAKALREVTDKAVRGVADKAKKPRGDKRARRTPVKDMEATR